MYDSTYNSVFELMKPSSAIFDFDVGPKKRETDLVRTFKKYAQKHGWHIEVKYAKDPKDGTYIATMIRLD